MYKGKKKGKKKKKKKKKVNRLIMSPKKGKHVKKRLIQKKKKGASKRVRPQLRLLMRGEKLLEKYKNVDILTTS